MTSTFVRSDSVADILNVPKASRSGFRREIGLLENLRDGFLDDRMVL